MDGSQQSSSKSPEPQRSGWPYVVGVVLTLAIESGWSAAEVRSLAIGLLVLLAIVHHAQR